MMKLFEFKKEHNRKFYNVLGIKFSMKSKNEFLGYEADIEYKQYKNFGKVIIKKYKNDCECINWLNKELKQYYPSDKSIPVAQHEFKALEILSEFEIAPKPLELGIDFIVIEYCGHTIENKNTLTEENYLKQANEILQKFKELGFKHNDLLPRNVLLHKNKLKIIDFTLAEFYDINIMSKLPNQNWAYPGDERLLDYYKTRS